MKELKRGLKAFLLALAAYLIQVCVMKHLSLSGVSGSVLFAVLSVLTVSYGKKYAFCASCIIGMLMESMLANVPAMYVLAYPVITMLCAQLFADLTERQRERRLSDHQGKTIFSRLRQKEMPALMRIPLCALLMDLIWHTVMCVYMYLIGVELDFSHFSRLFRAVVYTGVLTLVLMLPLRAFLGMYRRPKRKKKTDDDDLPLLRHPSFADEEEEDNDAQDDRQEMQANNASDEVQNETFDLYPEEGEW